MISKSRPITKADLDALAAGDVREWAKADDVVRNAGWARQEWFRHGDVEKQLGRWPSRTDLVEAACHHNGYLREAAVRRLGKSKRPEVLPLLLVRSVDWVPQVRKAARAFVTSTLDEPALRAMLPLIGVLSRRMLDDWMPGLLRQALHSEALFEDVLALDGRITRRWVYAEALRAGLLPIDRLLGIALQDNDFTIRRWCGDAALDTGDEAAIRHLLEDGTPAVRMRALTLLDVEVAEAHLTERTSLVRSMAQALVRKAGGDPAARYRALLADGVVTRVTVAGLGETGTRDDLDLLLSPLTAERPRARAEAVRGLRRITPDNAREIVLPLLTDPASSVVRQAVTVLHGVITKADEPLLFGLLAPDRPRHVRRGALALLRGRDSWTRLLVDLRLAGTFDDLAADADEDLKRWHRESVNLYTRPAPEVAAEITALLNRRGYPAREIHFLLTR